MECKVCGYEPTLAERQSGHKFCPSCGNAYDSVGKARVKKVTPYVSPTQLIELTSKRIKAAQFWCVVSFIVGMCMSIANNPLGGVIMVVAFLFFLGARIAAWWHHG